MAQRSAGQAGPGCLPPYVGLAFLLDLPRESRPMRRYGHRSMGPITESVSEASPLIRRGRSSKPGSTHRSEPGTLCVRPSTSILPLDRSYVRPNDCGRW
jgi:hypothetical protein